MTTYNKVKASKLVAGDIVRFAGGKTGEVKEVDRGPIMIEVRLQMHDWNNSLHDQIWGNEENVNVQEREVK